MWFLILIFYDFGCKNYIDQAGNEQKERWGFIPSMHFSAMIYYDCIWNATRYAELTKIVYFVSYILQVWES